MATYKATERGYISRIIEPGEVFEFDGKPGKWMEEVKTEPKGDQKQKTEPKGDGKGKAEK